VSSFQATEEQRQVIKCPYGPGVVTVQAVAGSGKTSVLVERARALIGRRLRSQQILFVTFSRSAAQTLRSRLGKAKLQCTAVTIHSLLNKVLPTESFTYDPDEVERLLREAYKVDRCGHSTFEEFSRAVQLAWMELWQAESQQIPEGHGMANALEVMFELRAAFREHTGRTLLGHDDLLIWGHRALQADDVAVRNLLTAYEFVIADEYQDVSPLQSEIIEWLARGKHFMVVADPAQSIYGFQGSWGQSFLRLARQSPPLKLSDNFRCPGAHLLAASSQLDGTQMLVPARGFYGELHVQWCGTHAEAFSLLNARVEALFQKGEEITILVRRVEEEEEVIAFLQRRGYNVVSLKQPVEVLFQNPACQLVLQPALEIRNKCRAAEHPIRKVLTFLGYALTPMERNWLDGSWSSMRTPEQARRSPEHSTPALELAFDLWNKLHAFDGDSRALLALLRPYLEAVAPEKWRLFAQVLDRSISLLDLETVLRRAEQSEARPVHVSTIHGAKGKEFPCVLIFELPRQKKHESHRSEQNSMDEDVIASGSGPEEDDIGIVGALGTEEDRVCYVALTRSTRLLYTVLPFSSNFSKALHSGSLEHIRRVQHVLSRSHQQWSTADFEVWPRLAQDPALRGYLERYWWRHTDPGTLRRARQILVDAGLSIPSSWAFDEHQADVPRRTTFRVKRVPFRILED